MNLNLEGKTALITGSAAGIGLNIALKLQEYGCKIGINLDIKIYKKCRNILRILF